MPHKLKVMALTFALLACPTYFVFSAALQPAMAADDTAGELAYWNKVKNSSNAADFKAYMDAYPNGMFSDIAMSKYKSLGGSGVASAKVAKHKTANTKHVKKTKTAKTKKSTHKSHKHPVKKKHVKHKGDASTSNASSAPNYRGGSGGGGGAGGSSGGGGGGSSGGGSGWH